MLAAIAGVPSFELLSTTMTSVVRSDGRSARTRSIACASLWVGMMTDTRTLIAHYHHDDEGRRRASNASTPHALPARPTARASDASTGTSSSHIHEVPHSEIQ